MKRRHKPFGPANDSIPTAEMVLASRLGWIGMMFKGKSRDYEEAWAIDLATGHAFDELETPLD